MFPSLSGSRVIKGVYTALGAANASMRRDFMPQMVSSEWALTAGSTLDNDSELRSMAEHEYAERFVRFMAKTNKR
jgi:hypothetical protein